MKSLIAAASALAVAAIAPVAAHAEDANVSIYTNLGYSYADYSPAHLHVLDGRIGARFAKYFGVEGEGAFGVGSDNVGGVDFKVKRSFGGYGVAFLPLGERADVFARIGYGHDTLKGSAGGVSVTVGEDSLNYGGGAQYFFAPNDGLRAEYTRHDLRNGAGDVNVYSVSYVHKF